MSRPQTSASKKAHYDEHLSLPVSSAGRLTERLSHVQTHITRIICEFCGGSVKSE